MVISMHALFVACKPAFPVVNFLTISFVLIESPLETDKIMWSQKALICIHLHGFFGHSTPLQINCCMNTYNASHIATICHWVC